MNATPQQMAARRYRIERYLTEGGMGAIYIGKKLGPGGFEKEVVLKQLLPEYTSRPEFRDLFFREAKISATLDHANIVHTFDLVESDESLFIVMEYVRGVDLRSIVRRAKLRRRELDPAAAIHIALEVLAGLGYAHTRRNINGASLSIIHRDVSPSNILCSAQGEVKLSDFGIAKASTHSSVFYRVRGKVGYMSPEQARNEAIDARSDLFSLAVCLYEALTAERLFVGDLSTPADVVYGQPIVPPSQKRKGLPAEVDAVLVKGLAAKPDDRYQDATAFAEALRQASHRCGLLFSAPQLAEHLRSILGPDPARWMNDETATQASDQGTQKIPVKALEGKEASSIGVVEGSNLYVVSGRDVVSPGAEMATSPKSGSAPGSDKGQSTQRVASPSAATASPSKVSPFIPIGEDDDDEPTVARDLGPPPAAARRPTGPAAPLSRPRQTTLPPPPPPAAFAPPPPPPLPIPPPRAAAAADSPFDIDSETPPPPPTAYDEFAPTPPPPTAYEEFAETPPPPLEPGAPLMTGRPPLGRAAHYPGAPGYGPPAVWDPGSGPAPLNLRPPETIDFGSEPIPVVRRSGPPGLLVLVVLLGAAAGGAKLAQVVTRRDMATLDAAATVSASSPAAPGTGEAAAPPPSRAPEAK